MTGETGTGKEVMAKALHTNSLRYDKPFVSINCAAIPFELLESELFGYMDGAFTGAKRGGKKGKFQLANGGTIFLDEIGDMPSSMQAKLLRVLQEKEIEPLGSEKSIPLDVRVVAATRQDLEAKMKDGSFREDLYYRLSVFNIHIPPLRERGGDSLELAEFFFDELNHKYKTYKTFSKAVKAYFLKYNGRAMCGKSITWCRVPTPSVRRILLILTISRQGCCSRRSRRLIWIKIKNLWGRWWMTMRKK